MAYRHLSRWQSAAAAEGHPIKIARFEMTGLLPELRSTDSYGCWLRCGTHEYSTNNGGKLLTNPYAPTVPAITNVVKLWRSDRRGRHIPLYIGSSDSLSQCWRMSIKLPYHWMMAYRTKSRKLYGSTVNGRTSRWHQGTRRYTPGKHQCKEGCCQSMSSIHLW